MNRRTSLGLTAGIAIAIFMLYSYTHSVGAQPGTVAAANKRDEEIFKDKILLLEVSHPDTGEETSSSVVLTNAAVMKLGDRAFVIGDGFATEDSEDDWYADMLVGVPCDSIVRFQAMTPERFKEYMKMWKDQSAK